MRHTLHLYGLERHFLWHPELGPHHQTDLTLARVKARKIAMTVTQLIIQISVTFVAAYFGAFLARRTERFKHLQELRSAAYADFVRGVAQAAESAQSDGMRDEPRTPEQPRGVALVADSRARIAIYGGKDVVHSLSEFIALGAQTCNSEGMQAFANLCRSMRGETDRERVSIENIKRILFS
jgi:hypothetical protein